jgi:sugar phosphate isomerase/epimerase
MRLGGPVSLHSDDPEELARAHRALGYRAAYAPEADIDDRERMSAIRQAFARHDVVIAETGVWNNMMDPEEAARSANIEAMAQGLARADELGALCCVNIAGGLNGERWDGPHPGNFSGEAFDLAVENARKIVDEVRPATAKLTYEMMPFMIPDSPDCYLELIEAVARPAFGVHLDVVNIINSPYRYYDTTAVIQECFEKLGPHIVSCHLKDIRLRDDLTVHLEEVIPGEGGFDIAAYLDGISRLPHQPPVMLEHLRTEDEYGRARQYVLGLAREIELDFES